MFSATSSAESPTADAYALKADALSSLFNGNDLSCEQAEQLFEELVQGEMDDPAIAAMLVALNFKGITTDELSGAARALSVAAVPFDQPHYMFADTCGTGGDSSGSINVSTAVGFVAAAAGLPIAKHGNRSVTSRCGSADVLEALGARIDINASDARALLDELGFCFLYAPSYHPGLRHAGAARRRLGVRTIMNFLGPCLNPAHPPIQLLGVADPKMLDPVARTLDSLGIEQALVVHGAGLDEIALHDETKALRLSRGVITAMIIRPEDAGLERASIEEVRGGDPKTNAQRLISLFDGTGTAVERDIVLINSGALLMISGMAQTLSEGVALSRSALESGAAKHLLSTYIEASHG